MIAISLKHQLSIMSKYRVTQCFYIGLLNLICSLTTDAITTNPNHLDLCIISHSMSTLFVVWMDQCKSTSITEILYSSGMTYSGKGINNKFYELIKTTIETKIQELLGLKQAKRQSKNVERLENRAIEREKLVWKRKKKSVSHRAAEAIGKQRNEIFVDVLCFEKLSNFI